MRKPFPLASTVLIVALCVAVVIQARTISDLNNQLARLRSELAIHQERAKLDQKEIRELKSKNEIFTTESEELRRQLGKSPTEAPDADKTASAVAGFGKTLEKMMSDPGMKDMMRSQQAIALRGMYADFVKRTGLTGDKADKLYELLADRQMSESAKGLAAFQEKDAAKRTASADEAKQAHESYDPKLNALLGPDGVQQLKEYEKSIPDRAMMQQYDGFFTSAGQPLTSDQKEALLQIMVDERGKSPPTPFDVGNQDINKQMDALKSDQAMHDLLAAQNDLNQRVLSRAGEVLNNDQLSAFQKAQQQFMQMQEAGIKMSRAMFGQ